MTSGEADTRDLTCQGGEERISALDRRRFLKASAAFLAALILGSRSRLAGAFAQSRGGGERIKRFTFSQLHYRGGNWDPVSGAISTLVRELEAKTSIEAHPAKKVVTLTGPDLYSSPFLYMPGNGDFEPFQDDEIDALRLFIKSGGTLLGDDCAGTPHYGFDAAFRREMSRIFPENPLKRLPLDHTVFKSFFLIRGIGGGKIVSPFIEGITMNQRTAVIYSPNGLGSAWAQDASGNWRYDTSPGGIRQRQLAFQLGINIVMYSLCNDYKEDKIHLPFIRQKI